MKGRNKSVVITVVISGTIAMGIFMATIVLYG